MQSNSATVSCSLRVVPTISVMQFPTSFTVCFFESFADTLSAEAQELGIYTRSFDINKCVAFLDSGNLPGESTLTIHDASNNSGISGLPLHDVQTVTVPFWACRDRRCDHSHGPTGTGAV